jgi:uncharacterized protein YbbK (DUF523 family)
VSAFHDRYDRLHLGDAASAEDEARAVGAEAQAKGQRVVAVSACLLGERVRWDGGDRMSARVSLLLDDPAVAVLPLCPEILGGLGCPRAPMHWAGDHVLDDAGNDRTLALNAGAARADVLVHAAGASEAILKERSPSCGVRQVHGSSGLEPRQGAFAARLVRRGLRVLSDEDLR